VLAVVPIPSSWETTVVVQVAGWALALLVLAACARNWRGMSGRARIVIALLAIHGTCLVAYYGLHFGAPYFLSRYFFPLSPFLALAWSWVIWKACERFEPVKTAWAGGVALLAIVAYPNVRKYQHGREHMHFQVVEWVERNVSSDEWVGAVQTGTVGYFHDLTLNLDGKVNPEALAAVLARRIPEYVIQKPIRYLADWAGLVEWTEIPAIAAHFELVVHDPVLDLTVLRRKDRRDARTRD
jgi:hypothetical protein